MGPITSITTLLALAPIIKSTTIVVKDLHVFSSKGNVNLDQAKVKLIQETLGFWIVWPFVSKITNWLPLGTLIGLYINIWLVWPLVNTPSNVKITGTRLILDDYLPQWLTYIEKRQMEFIDLALKHKDNVTFKLLALPFGAGHVVEYLQDIKDKQTSSDDSWNIPSLTIQHSFLTSLLLPLFDFSSSPSDTKSTSRPLPGKTILEVESHGSYDDFAIVTEKDFKESSLKASTSGLSVPKNSNSSPVSRKSSNSQIRKVSSSSFSSKFGFFS